MSKSIYLKEFKTVIERIKKARRDAGKKLLDYFVEQYGPKNSKKETGENETKRLC